VQKVLYWTVGRKLEPGLELQAERCNYLGSFAQGVRGSGRMTIAQQFTAGIKSID
jgi:hypothetical protein